MTLPNQSPSPATAAPLLAQPGASTHSDMVALCAAVLPVWGRHLAVARSQSEAAVTEMLNAFAEIRPHLDMAARQSRQITAALAQGDGGITHLAQACQAELQPLIQRLDPQAGAVLERVTSMIQRTVTALEQIAQPFDHETRMVTQQVDRMYVGFQYQDRINQLMTLLYDDIQRLCALSQHEGPDESALNKEGWLARLESQYAMAEQRQNHTQAAPDGSPQAAGDDVETVFF